MVIIACITLRNHLARYFWIPCEDVIVSWLCSAFAAHVMRRRFVNGGECRIIRRHHICCVSTFLVIKSVLLFAAAAIPSRQAPQATCLTHASVHCSLIEPSFAK